jgi:hypothetical protein
MATLVFQERRDALASLESQLLRFARARIAGRADCDNERGKNCEYR